MNWRNLMDAAREMAGQVQPQPSGRPRQEPLKRAVSSAYYAMFHALCQSNADSIIGRRRSTFIRLAWTRTYRALDHRQARNRLAHAQREIPAQARAFATAFQVLQEQRHDADYNPLRRFSRGEVIALLNIADVATQEYVGLPSSDRRAIAALVLLQDRATI